MLDESTFQQLLAAAYTLQGHNDRLHDKQTQVDHTQTLAEIVETQKLIQTQQLDLQSAAALIAERVQKVTNASGAAIGVIEADGVEYRAATGSASSLAGLRLPIDSCLSAACLREGQILQVPVTGKDSRLPAELCRERGLNALIAVPVYHEGKIAGAVELHFARANSFHEHDVRTCQLMAGLVTEAIARFAEREWKHVLAAERTAMVEALDRIKPQLERLTVERATPSVEIAEERKLEPPLAIPISPDEGPPPQAAVSGKIRFEQVEVPDPPQAASAAQIEVPQEPSTAPVAPPTDPVASPAMLAEPIAVSNVPESKPESEAICRGCGHHFVDKEYFCGVCGTARLERSPNGEMESTWSSLWHLQQAEKKNRQLSAPPVEAKQDMRGGVADHPAAIADTSAEELHQREVVRRANSGAVNSGAANSAATPKAEFEPDTLFPSDAPLPPELREIIERFASDEQGFAENSADAITETAAEPPPDAEGPLRIVPAETVAEVPSADETAAAIVPAPATPQPYPWTSAASARGWLESLRTQRPSRAWWSQVWRRQRANIYLGTATVTLLVVLSLVLSGWGTRPQDATAAASASPAASARRRRNPPPPELTLFEKMLVSVGLAEAPPAPVYLGNPNTQVWVDLHTALYYCPGADLYGKTEGGKYTSQHDAQQDQFEPAFRKACD